MLVIINGSDATGKPYINKMASVELNKQQLENYPLIKGYHVDMLTQTIYLKDEVVYRIGTETQESVDILISDEDNKDVMDAYNELGNNFLVIDGSNKPKTHFFTTMNRPQIALGLENDVVVDDYVDAYTEYTNTPTAILDMYNSTDRLDTLVISGMFSTDAIQELVTVIGRENIYHLYIDRNPSVQYVLNKTYNVADEETFPAPYDSIDMSSVITNSLLNRVSMIDDPLCDSMLNFENIILDGFIMVNGTKVMLPMFESYNNIVTQYDIDRKDDSRASGVDSFNTVFLDTHSCLNNITMNEEDKVMLKIQSNFFIDYEPLSYDEIYAIGP